MTLDEFLRQLDKETLLKLIIAIKNEFPVVRYNLINISKEIIKETVK